MQSKIFYHSDAHKTVKKGRRPRTTDDPEGGLEALDDPETARVGECPQLLPPFLGSPGGEQSEPLLTIEAG